MSSRKSRAFQELLVQPGELGNIFSNLVRLLHTESIQNSLKEIFQDIDENFTGPLMMIPTDQLEYKFDFYAIRFQSTLKRLINVLENQPVRSLEKNDVNQFYQSLSNLIETNLNAKQSLLVRVRTMINYWSIYDKVLLKNVTNKPDELERVLFHEIPIDNLRKYVSGNILAFYCILSSTRLSHERKVKLDKFITIGEFYVDNMLDYVEAIDILCNREENIPKDVIHRNPEIAGIIGKALVSRLSEKFRMDNRGRFIAINYSGQIMAISDTLEGLNKELVSKGVEEDCYTERLGYDVITTL